MEGTQENKLVLTFLLSLQAVRSSKSPTKLSPSIENSVFST